MRHAADAHDLLGHPAHPTSPPRSFRRASGSSFETSAELREVDVGRAKGLTYRDAAERWPEVFDPSGEARFPGGESFAEVADRADCLPALRGARRPRARPRGHARRRRSGRGGEASRLAAAIGCRVPDRQRFAVDLPRRRRRRATSSPGTTPRTSGRNRRAASGPAPRAAEGVGLLSSAAALRRAPRPARGLGSLAGRALTPAVTMATAPTITAAPVSGSRGDRLAARAASRARPRRPD